MNRLYVGNLAFQATEAVVQEQFSECGEVASVALVLDHVSGRSRGFAFVEMASAEGAQKALAALNGRELLGRSLRVDVAEERRNGPTGGGGRGRSGGDGGGGGGGWRAGR
jgi:RNA recognition motif-containing protein